jgi:excisionase family DNA binding protein
MEPEKPISVKEAAKYLGVAENTLYVYMRKGVIPPKYVHRLGRNVYLFKSELFEMLKKS